MFKGKVKFNKLKLMIFSIIIVAMIIVAIIITFNHKYLKEEQRECLIQFNTNGGTLIKEQKINCGDTINEPTSPQKNGFIFEYWDYNGKKYDFSSSILDDTMLNAIYTKENDIETVTITFDTSGGSIINPIEIKKGETLENIITPTMSRYKFVGWYKNYEKYDFSLPINENITLKAKWEENNEKKPSIITSSNKYKCSGSFRSDIPEKEVTLGYSNHVNWTWSTYGGYSDDCFITYKTSDSKIATVNENGIITTKSIGNVLISECINDTETKKEVVCFKGQLRIKDKIDNTENKTSYDDIVNKYSGIWYLENYQDVYITISKFAKYYEAMDISPANIDIYNGGIYPGTYGNIQISYENWDVNMKKYNVTLNDNYILIKTPKETYKFVKKRGKINKYSNSSFYDALGTWYLYNEPLAQIIITKSGDDTNPLQEASYCITVSNFNFKTLKYEVTSTRFGCNSGTNNKLLDEHGIKIFNGEMTITNSAGTVKFYKTKKVISIKSISLNKNELNLKIGDLETLFSIVTPEDAYNKNEKWSSSNTSVATVVNGKVTAVGEGTTIISVKTEDGSKSASCTVNVSSIKATGISLNKSSLNLVKKDSATLIATILPSNVTNKNVIWSSSDTSVATVDNNGKVNALKKGTAVISATTADGSYSAKCEVKVSNPKLMATGTIGISTIFSGGVMRRGVFAEVTATGGSEKYTSYNIYLYKDGVLIGRTYDYSKNSIFVSGYNNGNYTMEYEVRDSDGERITGTKNVSISGF